MPKGATQTKTLKVGDKAPDFTLMSHLDKKVSLSDLHGKNVFIAFYPLDWTPVWGAQLPSYEDDKSRFEELNTQVLGISVDSIPSHAAWSKSIGGISYPLLSDFYPHGAVSKAYGVFREDANQLAYGACERALFIIDKEGIVRFIDVHPIEKQPDNEEIFEALRKLQ